MIFVATVQTRGSSYFLVLYIFRQREVMRGEQILFGPGRWNEVNPGRHDEQSQGQVVFPTLMIFLFNLFFLWGGGGGGAGGRPYSVSGRVDRVR